MYNSQQYPFKLSRINNLKVFVVSLAQITSSDTFGENSTVQKGVLTL